MEFKLSDQAEDVKRKIEETGMQTLAYDTQFGFFRVNVGPLAIDKKRGVLCELIRQAWEVYGKP